MKRRTVGLVGALALGCTPSEPPPEVERPSSEAARTEPVAPPEPIPPELRRELGERLGGTVTARQPTPGRWASRVRFNLHRFVTMEHTIERDVAGTAVLQLGDDGSARACFSVAEVDTSDMSHYQAHDGQDHHDERKHAVMLGATGRWTVVDGGPGIEIVFDRRNYQTCTVDPASEPFAVPPLRCYGFAANPMVPADAVLCSVPDDLHPATALALLIGDSPRAGAWALRDDPARDRVTPPPDARPWLLLGADPGLELVAEDHDRDAKPLTITVGTVADPVAPAAESN